MKATITFNLPEDQQEYDRANAATKLCGFIWDFENYLRGLNKEHENYPVDRIAEMWFEIKDFDLDTIYQ